MSKAITSVKELDARLAQDPNDPMVLVIIARLRELMARGMSKDEALVNHFAEVNRLRYSKEANLLELQDSKDERRVTRKAFLTYACCALAVFLIPAFRNQATVALILIAGVLLVVFKDHLFELSRSTWFGFSKIFLTSAVLTTVGFVLLAGVSPRDLSDMMQETFAPFGILALRGTNPLFTAAYTILALVIPILIARLELPVVRHLGKVGVTILGFWLLSFPTWNYLVIPTIAQHNLAQNQCTEVNDITRFHLVRQFLAPDVATSYEKGYGVGYGAFLSNQQCVARVKNAIKFLSSVQEQQVKTNKLQDPQIYGGLKSPLTPQHLHAAVIFVALMDPDKRPQYRAGGFEAAFSPDERQEILHAFIGAQQHQTSGPWDTMYMEFRQALAAAAKGSDREKELRVGIVVLEDALRGHPNYPKIPQLVVPDGYAESDLPTIKVISAVYPPFESGVHYGDVETSWGSVKLSAFTQLNFHFDKLVGRFGIRDPHASTLPELPPIPSQFRRK